MRILLIEDDEASRRVTVRILEHAGHTVSWAANGERGLEQMRHEAPDVLILDLLLPGKSGFEVAGEMRFDPKLREIPIIILSGMEDEEIRARSLAISHCLAAVSIRMSKPPNVPKLLEVLERMYATRHQPPEES